MSRPVQDRRDRHLPPHLGVRRPAPHESGLRRTEFEQPLHAPFDTNARGLVSAKGRMGRERLALIDPNRSCLQSRSQGFCPRDIGRRDRGFQTIGGVVARSITSSRFSNDISGRTGPNCSYRGTIPPSLHPGWGSKTPLCSGGKGTHFPQPPSEYRSRAGVELTVQPDVTN